MNCKKCGKQLPNNTKFCDHCGKKVKIINPFLISCSVLLLIAFLCFIVFQYSGFFNKTHNNISSTKNADTTVNNELNVETNKETDNESDTEIKGNRKINRTITIKSSKTSTVSNTSNNVKEVLLNSSFSNISSSSELMMQSGNSYGVENIFDDNLDTAWVEGNENNGIGEWVLFKTENEVEITQLDIYNGYQKSNKSLTVNNQVREVEISFNDGSKINSIIKKVDTIDSSEKYTSIILDKPVKTSELLITIKDVYPSQDFYDESNDETTNACNDTCISEVEIYGFNQ